MLALLEQHEDAMKSSDPSTASLPIAGPTAMPQLIEIDVAPWRRIAVLFRSVKAERGEESGAIWYWRPETAASV